MSREGRNENDRSAGSKRGMLLQAVDRQSLTALRSLLRRPEVLHPQQTVAGGGNGVERAAR